MLFLRSKPGDVMLSVHLRGGGGGEKEEGEGEEEEKENSAHSLHTGSVKDKIIYFWLAGFYVKKNLVCPPPSCSDTALSTVWGALARSQDAVCIAPAAAAATAAGCCLVLALLLLPPPGSGGDGCCIRSCLAPHRHLACQSRGGGSEGAPARDGERARDLQGSGLVERRRARIRPRRARAPARQGPAGGGGGGARRLAHLAGERDGSQRGYLTDLLSANYGPRITNGFYATNNICWRGSEEKGILLHCGNAPLSMGFPRKKTGVNCHSLLQGIFPTQGLNPSLLHHWQILYQ